MKETTDAKTEKVRCVALPERGSNAVTFSPLTHRDKPLQKRDPPESQKPAPDHLKIVSQANGQEPEDLDGYYYDKSAGSGVTIYVIDSGFYEHKV